MKSDFIEKYYINLKTSLYSMTAFGWKRKAGQNILKEPAVRFSEDIDKEEISPELAWIKSFKRKKQCLQENCELKCEEYKSAGIKYAENQKYTLKL